MPGPVAPRASVRTFAFAAVAALPILVFCACSSDPGTTPSCIPDTTENGIKPTPGGCSVFPVCTDDKGNPADPMVCCKDAKDLHSCLVGYGDPSAISGDSSSSSSGSGMMDAGDNG